MDGPTDNSSSSNKNEVIDFDDPLYIHPSDNVVTTLVTIKLTSIASYRIWNSVILRRLNARNKVGFVDGTIGKQTNDPVMSLKWE